MLALGVFGVSSQAAVGYAVLFHASQFVPVTVIGWISLLREHVTSATPPTLGRVGPRGR